MSRLMGQPVGIYEKAIPDRFGWADKIKIAQIAGYDFIELSIDESKERLDRLHWSKEERKELRDLLWQADFYIQSMCLSGHRKYPFGSKNKVIREKAYKIMDQAIELAKDLNIRNIQLAGYDVYYETSDEETKELFLEGLRYAAKKAAAVDIMLSIEIMDTEFMGTITKCLKYINIIASPWLQIYPDIGNLSQWIATPELELEKGIMHIVGIHLKDTQPNKFKCVPFGEGTVEFESLFKKLKELDFQGPYLVEMWAEEKKVSFEEVVHTIQEARKWLMKKAGDN